MFKPARSGKGAAGSAAMSHACCAALTRFSAAFTKFNLSADATSAVVGAGMGGSAATAASGPDRAATGGAAPATTGVVLPELHLLLLLAR